jgi:hypothetical protein
MRKSLIRWWARLDSNQGPKDYESLEKRQPIEFSEGRACQRVPDCDLPRHNGVTSTAQPEKAKFALQPARNGASRRSDRIHGGNYTPKRSWRVLAVLSCALIPASASCQTWAAATIASHHFGATQHYEERNYGLGFEAPLNRPRLAAVAGEYRNSFHRTSVYAGLAWTPLAWGPAHFGIIGGIVTGYRPDPVLPMLLPTTQLELGRFGANLYFAPKIKNGASVVGLQLKILL